MSEILPRELQHPRIKEWRDVGTLHTDHEAYQIVFDQTWQPYDFWNPQPEGWYMHYARLERHNPYDGWLAKIMPDRSYLCVVVSQKHNHPAREV